MKIKYPVLKIKGFNSNPNNDLAICNECGIAVWLNWSSGRTKGVHYCLNNGCKHRLREATKKEYEQGIIYNEQRLLLAIERMKLHIKLKRLPALVICQFHEHINITYMMYNKVLGKRFKIAYVHGDIKERKKILEDFRDGKIDILIASFIVKRGKNFPLIKYIQNLAGSDSQETIWQIMGRGERKHESKTRTFMDDFYDKGKYLERHSKHRIRYYKQTGFRVKLKI